jgi:hypothetical protein
MTLTHDPEFEALQALVESEGWKLWSEYVDREFGSVGFGRKVSLTIGDPSLAPELAVQQLQQATAVLNAVQRICGWPKERMQQLRSKHQPTGATMSRRGPGL